MRFVYLWKRSKNFKGVLQEKHFKWKYFRGQNFLEQVVYSHDRRSAFVYLHPKKDYIVTWKISAPLSLKLRRMCTCWLILFLTLCEDWTDPRESRNTNLTNKMVLISLHPTACDWRRSCALGGDMCGNYLTKRAWYWHSKRIGFHISNRILLTEYLY